MPKHKVNLVLLYVLEVKIAVNSVKTACIASILPIPVKPSRSVRDRQRVQKLSPATDRDPCPWLKPNICSAQRKSQQSEYHMFIIAWVRSYCSVSGQKQHKSWVDSMRRRCLLPAYVHQVSCLRHHGGSFTDSIIDLTTDLAVTPHPDPSKNPVLPLRGGGVCDNYFNRRTVVFGRSRSVDFIVRAADAAGCY